MMGPADFIDNTEEVVIGLRPPLAQKQIKENWRSSCRFLEFGIRKCFHI